MTLSTPQRSLRICLDTSRKWSLSTSLYHLCIAYLGGWGGGEGKIEKKVNIFFKYEEKISAVWSRIIT